MAEVFLSYSQKDRPAVERIAAKLDELGLTAWYDARLESGDSFDAVIAAELRGCKAVLVCWSPDAIASRWVRSEAMFGYDRSKLAAASLTQCDLTPPFNLVHAIDLGSWRGEVGHSGWLALIRGLAKICDRPGVAGLAVALADGHPERLRAWSREYPTEPLAREMWSSREAALRADLLHEMEVAKEKLDSGITELRAKAELALASCLTEFEAWIELERRSSAGDRPNPISLIEALIARGDPHPVRAMPQPRPEQKKQSAHDEAGLARPLGQLKQAKPLSESSDDGFVSQTVVSTGTVAIAGLNQSALDYSKYKRLILLVFLIVLLVGLALIAVISVPPGSHN